MVRFFWVRSCLLITLIKCLKGHKSLGSLGSVVKGLIVSLVGRTNGPTNQGTRSPIELFWTANHLLSCSGKAKNLFLQPLNSQALDLLEIIRATIWEGLSFSLGRREMALLCTNKLTQKKCQRKAKFCFFSWEDLKSLFIYLLIKKGVFTALAVP